MKMEYLQLIKSLLLERFNRRITCVIETDMLYVLGNLTDVEINEVSSLLGGNWKCEQTISSKINPTGKHYYSVRTKSFEQDMRNYYLSLLL